MNSLHHFIVLPLLWFLPVAAGAQTPAQGKQIFLTNCAVCHVPPDAATQMTRIGPSLRGVVGRKAGTLAGFRYTPAMKAYAKVWTPALLDPYLTAPRNVVPGTAMSFPGFKDPKQRAAVIAYLKANSKR